RALVDVRDVRLVRQYDRLRYRHADLARERALEELLIRLPPERVVDHDGPHERCALEVRAVVRHLVADAVDDDRVLRLLELLCAAEHGHRGVHAVRRALLVHRLDEGRRESVLSADEDPHGFHRYTSTISFQYGQSCAQPSHRCRLAGTPFSWSSPASRRESSTLRSSLPVAMTISVARSGSRERRSLRFGRNAIGFTKYASPSRLSSSHLAASYAPESPIALRTMPGRRVASVSACSAP